MQCPFTVFIGASAGYGKSVHRYSENLAPDFNHANWQFKNIIKFKVDAFVWIEFDCWSRRLQVIYILQHLYVEFAV